VVKQAGRRELDHCWLCGHCFAVLGKWPTFHARPPGQPCPTPTAYLSKRPRHGPGTASFRSQESSAAGDERSFCFTISDWCVLNDASERGCRGAGSAFLGIH
jgi:hypothetical protein